MRPSLAAFMAIILFCPAVRAQQDNPSLDAILTRLQNSLDDYRASVPRFFCSEHIFSSWASTRLSRGSLSGGSRRSRRKMESISRVDSESGMTSWYFEATYSNYHKLTVNSRIVPVE